MIKHSSEAATEESLRADRHALLRHMHILYHGRPSIGPPDISDRTLSHVHPLGACGEKTLTASPFDTRSSFMD